MQKYLTKTKSLFVVKPKVHDQTIITTKSDVSNIDLVDSNMKISKFHGTRKGSLVLGCDADKSAKFKELASSKLMSIHRE